ncbi:MAG: PQQ-dependent sugar dehydrogenase [Anaerolineae bacterium]
MRRIWQLTLAIGLGLAGWLLLWLGASRPPAVTAQGNITWPQISLSLHTSGLNQPLHIAHAGDGSGRLFLVERRGLIWIVKDGALLSTPFLDIASRVGDQEGEQGLLSVAFPPDYASQGIFYVDYTDNSGDTVVARYRLTSNPDVADPDSEEIILRIEQPYPNHNGGQLAFGPNDGYLYIATGDGGSGGDPDNNAQNPASLLGKLLRIDVGPSQAISSNHRLYLPIIFAGEGPANNNTSYRIPEDNPYVNTPGYRGEVWSLGLRNPWRFSFDRETGDLYIADVGQGSYEEVNHQPASSPGGENYGWRIMEGFHCYNAGACDTDGLTLPVVEYDHSQGCSVTGGLVYRGQDYPGMQGIYFYADFCSGRIWGLKYDGAAWQSALLLDTPYGIASFGEDEAGNLYLSDYFGGSIYRIIEQP